MSTANATQIGGNHYASKAVQPWDAMQAWLSREAFIFLSGLCDRELFNGYKPTRVVFLSGLCDRELCAISSGSLRTFLSGLCDREL